MKEKTKALTLILTSVVALGTATVLTMTNSNNTTKLFAAIDRSVPNSSRTVTVNYNNSYRDIIYDGESRASCAAFLLDDEMACAIVYTTQRQIDLPERDNAVLILWDFNTPYFYANFWGGGTIRIGNNDYDTAMFRHLTQLDIKLNKGNNGEDRILTLKSEIDGYAAGSFTKIDETSEYIQYAWRRDNNGGYLRANETLKIMPGDYEKTATSKAIWVTDLVFHYEC